MRRAVITGMGIVSCIGNNKQEVLVSLREGRSGISVAEEFKAMGFRSHVQGKPNIDLEAKVDRKLLRFMGDGSAYNYIAMEEAINDAGLAASDVSNERTGLIMGSGGPSTRNIVATVDTAREKGPRKVSPFMVPRTMSSTNSATLATPFKIHGVNYSISSACATSAHCIGNAAELIQWGKQDIVFAGGGEELDWSMSVMFDAMQALSSKYNDNPTKASRAFDRDRDGFVIAGGGGVVVVEEYEHAKARGAKIYGEVAGYGMSGDAYHITAPSEDGNGGFRAMRSALKDAGLAASDIGYVNAHGTSTPLGDEIELRAVERLFGAETQGLTMSSTKSAIGHLLGAAGSVEAIFSLLVLRDQIAPPTLNLRNPSVETQIDLVPLEAKKVVAKAVLSNSFGFGGTNAALILKAV